MTNQQIPKLGMFTDYGNIALEKIAELYLKEQPITPYDIDLIVWSFDQYVEKEHDWFASHHGEYSDTAVRDNLHDWFTKKVQAGFYQYLGERANG